MTSITFYDLKENMIGSLNSAYPVVVGQRFKIQIVGEPPIDLVLENNEAFKDVVTKGKQEDKERKELFHNRFMVVDKIRRFFVENCGNVTLVINCYCKIITRSKYEKEL